MKKIKSYILLLAITFQLTGCGIIYYLNRDKFTSFCSNRIGEPVCKYANLHEYVSKTYAMEDMELCNSMLIYKDKEYIKNRDNDVQYIKAKEKRDKQLDNRETFKEQKYQEFHRNFRWQWECVENLYCVATHRGDVIAKQYNTDCFLDGKPCFVYEIERNMPDLFEKYGEGSKIDDYLDSLNDDRYGNNYDLVNFERNYPYDKQFEAHLIREFGQETVNKCNRIISDLDNKNLRIFFYRMMDNEI